jgi:hypothetical protein
MFIRFVYTALSWLFFSSCHKERRGRVTRFGDQSEDSCQPSVPGFLTKNVSTPLHHEGYRRHRNFNRVDDTSMIIVDPRHLMALSLPHTSQSVHPAVKLGPLSQRTSFEFGYQCMLRISLTVLSKTMQLDQCDDGLVE